MPPQSLQQHGLGRLIASTTLSALLILSLCSCQTDGLADITGSLGDKAEKNRADEPSLKFSWVEQGGPPVLAHRGEGFGTQLLAMVGDPELRFAREGFAYTLTIPMAEVMR